MSIPNYNQIVRTTGGVEVKRAPINVSAPSGTIVPAVAGKRICVLGICLIVGSAAPVTFQSNGTPLTGPLPLAANGGFVVNPPADPAMHWLQTAIGEGLVLANPDEQQVSGFITYYEA